MENRFGWGSTPYMHILSDTNLSAPGENKRIWITDLFIECATGTTLQLQEGTSGDFLTPAIEKIDHTFNAPLKIATNTLVKVVKSGVGSAVIMIGYYIEESGHN